MVTSPTAVQRRPELIIALVCPLGLPVEALEEAIANALGTFNYACRNIRLSDLLRGYERWTPEADAREETRLRHRERLSAEFREVAGKDALARAGIAAIREHRKELTGSADIAASDVAYLLRQIKRPEEIHCLRRTYGPSLIVIAAHAPEETRIDALATLVRSTGGMGSAGEIRNRARSLIEMDQSGEASLGICERFGQNTRDAYPLADFF